MKNYIFPAIFTEEDRGISIEFPDLPGCLPCARDYDQAFRNAREAMNLHLSCMIEDGEEIPHRAVSEQLNLARVRLLRSLKLKSNARRVSSLRSA